MTFQGLGLFPAVQGIRSQLFQPQPLSRALRPCCRPGDKRSWLGVASRHQLLPMGWRGETEAARAIGETPALEVALLRPCSALAPWGISLMLRSPRQRRKGKCICEKKMQNGKKNKKYSNLHGGFGVCCIQLDKMLENTEIALSAVTQFLWVFKWVAFKNNHLSSSVLHLKTTEFINAFWRVQCELWEECRHDFPNGGQPGLFAIPQQIVDMNSLLTLSLTLLLLFRR